MRSSPPNPRPRTLFALPALVALVLLVAVGPAIAPTSQAAHASVPEQQLEVPCSMLEGPAEAIDHDLHEQRWTFSLTGAHVDAALTEQRAAPSLTDDAEASDSATGYQLELASQISMFMPEDTYGFIGPEFSTLTGHLVTDEATHDVELTWVSVPTNVHSPQAQAGYHMVLDGNVTFEDGSTAPIELRVTFAAAPHVCQATAQAFNWMHLCHEVGETAACLPAGWEIDATAVYYHDGPVAYTGTIDGQATAGEGLGHGYASNWAFANVPP